MKDLQHKAESATLCVQVKMREQGKKKEPVMRSLNPVGEIKNQLLQVIHKKYGVIPAEILGGEQLNKFMNEPLSNVQRLAWYKLKAQYRNNFKVK
jgi:hypothetical protein